MADLEVQTTKTRRGELRPWIGEPPRSEPPVVVGYQLAAHEQFDMVRGSITGVILMPFWWVLFTVVVGLLGGRFVSDVAITLPVLAAGAFIALVAVPVLHEAVHGVAALLVGARPAFGIGPGFVYTTFQEPVGKRAYLLVGLAPLVVLSAGGVALATSWDAAAPLTLFFMVVNASGAIGDLWMSWRVALRPGNALFVDLADGFAVLVPEEANIP